ncbi:hypothetical protein DMC30DRAFT_253617 [Rhodotorula diobovata]|uniref:Protein SQS1 n=1 Tax=Rhodotorula diobovata TaxID=5288 RepID=A0A5C5FWL0_9BASI|nr:hypothetical protein DMC30DRAFT_253617 [Rhodotorula diobovata]
MARGNPRGRAGSHSNSPASRGNARGRGGGRGGRGGRGGGAAVRVDHSMQDFDYADLVSDDMLRFTPSPVFQPPLQPAPQSGYGTPNRGARGGRGGRGGRGSPFPRGGGSANSSGRTTPVVSAPYPTRGSYGSHRGTRGGLGSQFGAAERGGRGGMRGGGFGGRGRGGAAYSGSSTPRHVVGLSEGAFNPLLVPVKFVRATGDGLGTVGGEDEHGLELAGAASPPRPQEKRLPRHSVEGALAAEVQNLALEADEDDVEDNPKGGPPPETAFEPEPATTATMALDELEDAPDAAEPTTHPGLGSRARQPVEREVPAPSPTAALPEATPDVDEDVAGGDDGPPLFEISVSRSTVTVDLPSSLAPPAALVAHDSSTPLSSDSSDSDSEQILFPRRAQAHADPVSSARPPAAAPRPAADLSLSTSSSHAPAVAARTRAPHPSQPAQPAKQSKKALKRASRAARKTGRLHARSGNAHLAGHGSGRRLDEDEDEDQGVAQEQAQDRAAGAALFAQMQGAKGVDDMLVASDDDDEQDIVDAEGHVPGQPRQGDSDLEWGSSSPAARGPPRGRAKKAALRAQRADQRERDKLERLVAAGATREEVEVALALEMSLEAERRDARERERRRAEEDYAANVRNDEGDDSMAVLAAFARGAVGQLGGTHERGDDADRRMAEDEEDEDEWGTSSDGESEDEEESDEEDDDDTEGAHDRRLALEEEEGSDEVDSDDELEMEYSLGDADGRVEHSLSIASDEDSFDSSLSSSTDSDAELFAFESALLAGQKISLQRMGQSGSGGRKDERERKKARARQRKGKGKAHVVDSRSSEEDSDDDDGDDVMFTGQDSWADRDEDYISKVQAAVRLNTDLLSTAQGGRAARRSNRRERNKLFNAISQGNFDDIDLYDEAADLDEDLVEAMFAEQEEMGFAGPSKKQRKKDKTFNGAFSAQLAAQWDLDRSKKASKKAQRAAERAAAREAEFRDTYRDKSGAYSRGKAGAKRLAAGSGDDNDAATINTRIRHFIVTDLSATSLSLPPMAKKARIAVHLLAEVYGLKSRSLGSGKNRFPVLERTSKTTVVGVSERRVRAIVGTADGEHELGGFDADWGGPRGKGKYRGKVGGLWKALEGASGKKSGGGRRDQLGKNSEGAVVGQGADRIGEDNVGFALLKKMGWTEGGQIGLSGQGLHEPVVARVKTGKSGLGSGFAVSRGDAQALARGPE